MFNCCPDLRDCVCGCFAIWHGSRWHKHQRHNSSDTTWTLANSPYTLTGNVLVNNGVTLTIQAGVQVYLGNYYLEVNGTLNASGTTTDEIQFISVGDGLQGLDIPSNGVILFTSASSSWNGQTNSGCIIENAFISSTQPIPTVNIDGSSPEINNCTIINTGGQRSIWISNGAPVISNNTITSNFAGITVNLGTSTALISDNDISGCSVGIEIYGGSPIVEGNLIIDNTGSEGSGDGGIRINYSGTNPLIRNNTITENSVGLNLLASPSPTIFYNNIQDNSNYDIYLNYGEDATTSNNINATYNWWGTTNTQAINQTIYDFKDNFNLGNVTFVPFLTAPNTQAPTYIDASAGAGGSVSPSGVVSVNYGGSQTFTITPNSGYYIVDVLVNGSSVGAVSTYTVQGIDAATTISTTFAPNPTPTPSPSPTQAPTATPNPTPTSTPSPTSTATATPTPTSTSTPASTVTPNHPSSVLPQNPTSIYEILIAALVVLIVAFVVVIAVFMRGKRR